MKQTKKNYNFYDLKSDFEKSKVNKNTLSVCEKLNLSTDSGNIKPLAEFENLFLNILSESEYETFFENNSDILNSIIFLEIYEYFDEELDSYQKRIFAITSDLILYELNQDDLTLDSLEITFSSLPKTLKYDDKLYFYGEDNNFIVFDHENLPLTITSMPNIKKILFHDETLIFFVKSQKNTIFIYDDSEIENLTTSIENFTQVKTNTGYGEILDIVIFKQNLYIIQQYAISKLSESSNGYELSSYCSIASKIKENTTKFIDDYLIFLTTSGLYIFDGNDIKQIFLDYTKFIVGDKQKSEVYNNHYYLITKYIFGGVVKCVLLDFDYENDTCNIFDLNEISNIYSIVSQNYYKLITVIQNTDSKNELLCLNANKFNSRNKYIKFNFLTFDDDDKKSITALNISSIGKYKIKIKSDMDQINFNVSQNFAIQNISLQGRMFEFEFESDDFFEIKSISFTVSSVGE